MYFSEWQLITKHLKDEPVAGFDKFPRWFVMENDFSTLDELACKLLIYLCSTRKWGDNCTRWTTVEKLAAEVGATWRRTKRALMTLATIGVIRIETESREKRFKLIYKSPHNHSHEQGQGTTGQSRPRPRKTNYRSNSTASRTTENVDVPLDASVEGRSPSSPYAEKAHNSAQFGTQSCPKQHTTEDDTPAWARKHEEFKCAPGYYEAGLDEELRKPVEREGI